MRLSWVHFFSYHDSRKNNKKKRICIQIHFLDNQTWQSFSTNFHVLGLKKRIPQTGTQQQNIDHVTPPCTRHKELARTQKANDLIRKKQQKKGKWGNQINLMKHRTEAKRVLHCRRDGRRSSGKLKSRASFSLHSTASSLEVNNTQSPTSFKRPARGLHWVPSPWLQPVHVFSSQFSFFVQSV